MRNMLKIAILVAAVFTASSVCAQTYPDRPVRLIVGFPPGGAADILGRIVAHELSTGLKQQVVVDNRGGAGGILATMIVAQAPADGYTLLFGTSAGMLINPILNPKVPYDAQDKADSWVKTAS